VFSPRSPRLSNGKMVARFEVSKRNGVRILAGVIDEPLKTTTSQPLLRNVDGAKIDKMTRCLDFLQSHVIFGLAAITAAITRREWFHALQPRLQSRGAYSARRCIRRVSAGQRVEETAGAHHQGFQGPQ
jgi:hypothetical protein